jgi:hypothetical protein
MSTVLLAQGHDHVLSVGVSIGPMVLRIALLAAIPAVAGFALLRGFLAEPGRRATFAVAAAAAGAAVVELMLSGGLNLPVRVVPLLLVALAVPLFLILSTDARFTQAIGRARRFAPWVFGAAAVLALTEFARSWLDEASPAAAATGLHTGVVLGLVALAWFAVARPRGRLVTTGVRAAAAVLAMLLVAGAAQAVVLRGPEATPGTPATAEVALGSAAVRVVVVPNEPGWNLVHVQATDAAVGTSRDRPVQAVARGGTTGGWAVIELPAGRSDLWVWSGGGLASVPTDTGAGPAGPRTSLVGEDGPECASALLGRALAGTTGPSAGTACPADALADADAGTLRGTVADLARQGTRAIRLVTDDSARAKTAAGVVRAAASAHGVAVDKSGGPLVVVSGWTVAGAALGQAALGALATDGIYLAPWLAVDPLLTLAPAAHVAGTPTDDRYRTDLAARYPGEAPSTSGHRAWRAARPAL